MLRFAIRLVETPGYPLSKTDRSAAVLAVLKQRLNTARSLGMLLRYISWQRVWGCHLLSSACAHHAAVSYAPQTKENEYRIGRNMSDH